MNNTPVFDKIKRNKHPKNDKIKRNDGKRPIYHLLLRQIFTVANAEENGEKTASR